MVTERKKFDFYETIKLPIQKLAIFRKIKSKIPDFERGRQQIVRFKNIVRKFQISTCLKISVIRNELSHGVKNTNIIASVMISRPA